MTEATLIWWIEVVGSAVGILILPLGLCWYYLWRPDLELWWAAYRWRVKKNQDKADYIRWWRSQ